MWQYFKALEGWQRASLIGVALSLCWVLAFRARPIVFDGHVVSVLEVLGAVGSGFLVYFVVLWAWGISAAFPTWSERWHAANQDTSFVSSSIDWLILSPILLGFAGLEIALEALPRSVPFATGIPGRLLAAASRRGSPTDSESDGEG